MFLPVPKATIGSMPPLTSHIGLRRQPVSVFSPLDVLREHDLRKGFWAAPRHAVPQVAACSPAPAVRSFDHPNCHSATVGSLQYDGSTSSGKVAEVDLSGPIKLRNSEMQSVWQISDIDPFLMECQGRDRLSSLITWEDSQKSIPWLDLTSRHEDRENVKHQFPPQDVQFQDEGHFSDQQPGDDLRDSSEAAHLSQGPNSEEASGKRIASFQSSSDASTRRSSIWDDGYDREVEDDDASDVTGISESDEDDHGDEENICSTSLVASDSTSQLRYLDHHSNIPNLQQSNITVLRSLKQRRSSHPALMLLQAENAHIRADQIRIQEENTHLQAANTQLVSEDAHLLSQNTNLRACLSANAKSLATARDTVGTQDLQLHSLRRRVSFLERWVDSLHEEKVALNEENTALIEVGRARAQAVDDLRESYERLEDIVEKAVGASDKQHDCMLEIELEGVRGRLGGLRIVS